jgi:hypothetical protein
MKEQGKYKELAEAATGKAQRAERVAIRAELKALAINEGINDLLLIKLIDDSAISIDADGNVVGAAEAVAAFKTTKPAFFTGPAGAPTPAHVPGTAKPGSTPTGSIKVWADYIKMPEADRRAWAAKYPDSFRAIAATATGGK